MGTTGRAIELLRRALLPAACIALAALLGVRAATGENGVMAWRAAQAERAVVAQRAAAVKAEKAALEHRVALLDPRHVDPDLADELVRRNLGVVRPDEVVIPLSPAPEAGAPDAGD